MLDALEPCRQRAQRLLSRRWNRSTHSDASPTSWSPGRAETYKVRAFRQRRRPRSPRSGPTRLAELAPDPAPAQRDGDRRHHRPGHRRGPGRRDPAYLARLEAEQAGPALDGRGGRAAGSSWRGDCHSHSDWSDGGSPIGEMAAAATGPRPPVPGADRPQPPPDRGPRARRRPAGAASWTLVAELNEDLAPFRILTGIEVDILEDGSLDQDEELLAQLDVVVASVHSKLRMERGHDDPAMLAGHREPAHRHPRALHRPASRGPGPAPVAASIPTPSSRPAPTTGTAVEINSRPERRDPPDPAGAGRGGRVPGLHRHRCPRPGPARMARQRLCPGGRRRGPLRADRDRLAA